MPRGDGKGPPGGSGPGTGRGRGQGRDVGMGRNQGTRPGAGAGGNCLCPSCGATTPHQAGMPCNRIKCPQCGASMVRE